MEPQAVTPEPAFQPPPEPQAGPFGATWYRDCIFSMPSGFRPVMLDLAVPGAVGAPPPLAVWIHGGGWLNGHRRDLPNTYPSDGVIRAGLDAGLAVATIDYRHAGEAVFPAQLHDVKAAIRYLRLHSRELGLDGARIGVWGESAGGHLAALAGLTGDHATLEGDQGVTGVSSAVGAVVDWYGVADLTTMPEVDDGPGDSLIGGRVAAHRDAARRASPVTYVGPGAPPFLLVHGAADGVVPVEQSDVLAKRLADRGTPVTFRVLDGVDHIFEGYGDTTDLMVEAAAFLRDALRA